MINDPAYKATPVTTFSQFVEKWQKVVMAQHECSTQAADRSRLRVHLLPVLGDIQLKDFNAQLLQSFVAQCRSEC